MKITLSELRVMPTVRVIEYKCMAEQEAVKGNKDAKKTAETITAYLKRLKNKIEVFYEEGYDWTVDVRGEEESRVTRATKKEAMEIARAIKKEEFNGEAEIVAQTLNRKERSERTAYSHYKAKDDGYRNLARQ